MKSETNSSNIDLRLSEAAKFYSEGKITKAEEVCNSILEVKPHHPHAMCMLGTIAHFAGRRDEAMTLLEQAISFNPNFAIAHAKMGAILIHNGENKEALKSIEYALNLNPNLTEAINSKGVIYESLGRLDEAVAFYQACLKITPNQPEVCNNIGNIYSKRGQLEDAIKKYKEAININPDYDIALINMGNALQNMGRFIDAIESFIQAITVNPNNPDGHNGLGALLLDMGEVDEAIESFQRAITLAPHHPSATNNYLHTLLYSPRINNSELFDEYYRMISPNCSFKKSKSSSIFVDSDYSKTLLQRSPKNRGKLRIGYVSSDFYDHPLGNNFLPLITNHDQRSFEIFCYANIKRSDEITKKIQSYSDHWRKTNGLTDEQVAQKVRYDKIHILVFLGGHFDDNRPTVSIHRASPIQVSMHGGTTTALKTMDYLMTDALLHPLGANTNTTERFTETLCRLPNLYVYPYPENTPDVSS